MTGKVFKSSSNLYDDEAKVLFDYYKAAAEKIVAEEVEQENRIEASQKSLDSNKFQNKIFKILMIALGGVGLIGAILGLILTILDNGAGIAILIIGVILLLGGLFCLLRFLKTKKGIEEDSKNIEDATRAKENIRKDYKVNKLGVAYVPVASQVPFEGKSFVVDHTGATSNTEFSLSILRQPEKLQESVKSLSEGLKNVPGVEDNKDPESIDSSDYSKSVSDVTMHDYLSNINRQVKNISFLLNDVDVTSVSIPVVEPNSSEDEFLKEYATAETGSKPIVPVFSTESFANDLEGFSKLNELKKNLEATGGDSNAQDKILMKNLGDSVQLVSKVKTESMQKVLDYCNNIFSVVLKSGYNQYSPQLEAEELERIKETNFDYQECVESYQPFKLKNSSRVRFDLFQNSWVAEDGTRTGTPFAMNQIQEEVLMPVINNLMQETRIERLKIYNNIRDQKLSYLNKWHQDVEAAFRDNRAAGNDLITQITNAYAEYNTAYQTYISYKNTQDQMRHSGSLSSTEVQEVDASSETIRGWEEQAEKSSKASEVFQKYMEELQEDINKRSEQFNHVEYYEGSLRDLESRDTARSLDASLQQSLDDRHRRLLSVNTYYAAYADLPPVPSSEEKLEEDYNLNVQELADAKLAEIKNWEENEEALNTVATSSVAEESEIAEEASTTPAAEEQPSPAAEETATEETAATSEDVAETASEDATILDEPAAENAAKEEVTLDEESAPVEKPAPVSISKPSNSDDTILDEAAAESYAQESVELDDDGSSETSKKGFGLGGLKGKLGGNLKEKLEAGLKAGSGLAGLASKLKK